MVLVQSFQSSYHSTPLFSKQRAYNHRPKRRPEGKKLHTPDLDRHPEEQASHLKRDLVFLQLLLIASSFNKSQLKSKRRFLFVHNESKVCCHEMNLFVLLPSSLPCVQIFIHKNRTYVCTYVVSLVRSVSTILTKI